MVHWILAAILLAPNGQHVATLQDKTEYASAQECGEHAEKMVAAVKEANEQDTRFVAIATCTRIDEADLKQIRIKPKLNYKKDGV